MTFDDMMAMKRLGSTAVSPDGKWLGYSVTTVDLETNTKTSELWLQPIAGGDAKPLTAGQPGDDGLQFSPDNTLRILFSSSREQARANPGSPTSTPRQAQPSNPKRLTSMRHRCRQRQVASPDSKFIVFTSAVYPDCPAIHSRRSQNR